MNTGTKKPKVLFVTPLREYSPIGHQLLPVFFRPKTNRRPISLLRNHREGLDSELRKRRIRIRTTHVHDLAHPLPLLRCKIRGRRVLLGRVDQEDQGFSMTGFEPPSGMIELDVGTSLGMQRIHASS